MFRIIRQDQFVAARWKNGGGITHQIARDPYDPWAWRLSIADVASDGPFSRFDGMSRILTVIDGAGITLRSGDWASTAGLCVPLAFSGDLAVDSTLLAGPIRDLNVIYDAARISATVTVATGSATVTAAGLTGVLCLAGVVQADGQPLAPMDFAMGQAGCVTLGPDARAVVVRLTEV